MKNIVYVLGGGIENFEISFAEILVFIGLTLAVELVFYLLRSFGLYTLAKNNGVEKRWMCFVPALWVYPAAKLMGTIVISGKPFKAFAIIALCVFAAFTAVELTISFLGYFPIIGYYLSGGEIAIVNSIEAEQIVQGMGFTPYAFMSGVYVKGIIYPYQKMEALRITIFVLSLLQNVLSLGELIISVLLFMGIFRKFWPQRYILATVLSVLGLFAPIIFIIRNKKAIDFNDYMRSRYYGHGYNPYAGGPQNYQQRPTPPKEPESPFGEFESGNKKEDDNPFSDF